MTQTDKWRTCSWILDHCLPLSPHTCRTTERTEPLSAQTDYRDDSPSWRTASRENSLQLCVVYGLVVGLMMIVIFSVLIISYPAASCSMTCSLMTCHCKARALHALPVSPHDAIPNIQLSPAVQQILQSEESRISLRNLHSVASFGSNPLSVKGSQTDSAKLKPSHLISTSTG